MTKGGLIIIAVIAIACAAAPRAMSGDPPANDPLYIRLVATPMPAEAAVFESAGRRHCAYEVYVANFGATPITVKEIHVTGRKAGNPLAMQSWSGADLARMFALAGRRPKNPQPATPPAPTLKPGQAGVFFIMAEFVAEHALPENFETSLNVQGEGKFGGSGAVDVARERVTTRAPIVIQPPIRGANWLAANGPSNASAHRRAILFFHGRPRIGQRYAIDWIQLGADGNSWHGDRHKNSSYYAWSQDVYAAADGRVVEVKDGIAENTPESGKLAVEMTADTIAGNHIIEDLGGGRFAAYAHLRPGTIRVKVGDRVHAGEVLAKLGNSGNSSEPHLHFQVCDAPSFLDSEGLPFAIAAYTRTTHRIEKERGGKQALAVGEPQRVEREEPLEDELDSFGAK
jgi:Peptidase family M23